MRNNGSLVLIIGAICLLSLSYFISYYFNIPFSQLTKDPLSLAELNPTHGMLSNIGVVLWSMCVGICFITYYQLKGQNREKEQIFIAYSGFLSLMLLTDDLMMVHEVVVPYFFGFNEVYLYLVYLVLILFYLVFFKNFILRSSYLILILSLFLFGISILTDQFQSESTANLRYLLEDGSKFIGISCWAGFQFSASKTILNTHH